MKKLMYSVEYLLLANSESACNTVDTLCHLLQSRADISISKNKSKITYENKKTYDIEIHTGSIISKTESKEGALYFDINISTPNKSDIKDLSLLLKSIRKSLSSISDTSAIQILWDDISTHYSELAYPKISRTENLMRKLISKFMHINVGLEWTAYRVPDDVKKGINKNNNDDNYLFNIDFIKLKDVLLSESYVNDRDSLIRELKTSSKTTFTKEEIVDLLPMSNWDKYFSSHVNCQSDRLDKLWTKLYDLRCKVAHNKTFTLNDLSDCKKITAELDGILIDAIDKLDDIKIDKEESEIIFDEVVSNSRNGFVDQRRKLIQEYRTLQQNIYKLSTPYQETDKRTFKNDIEILRALAIISNEEFETIKYLVRVRHNILHADEESIEDPERWNHLINRFQLLNDKLQQMRKDKSLLEEEA